MAVEIISAGKQWISGIFKGPAVSSNVQICEGGSDENNYIARFAANC